MVSQDPIRTRVFIILFFLCFGSENEREGRGGPQGYNPMPMKLYGGTGPFVPTIS